jgi:hypothetical protein
MEARVFVFVFVFNFNIGLWHVMTTFLTITANQGLAVVYEHGIGFGIFNPAFCTDIVSGCIVIIA